MIIITIVLRRVVASLLAAVGKGVHKSYHLLPNGWSNAL
jgi:hypothetical protein